MKITIDEVICLELWDEDKEFLRSNTIFFKDNSILEQKCDLPEAEIWKFLYLLESYGYSVDLKMYSVGRFALVVE